MEIFEIREKLNKISENLLFTWNHEINEFFELLNKDLWFKSEKNPIKFLKEISDDEIKNKFSNKDIEIKFKQIFENFEKYLNSSNYLEKERTIVYLSPEFGFTKFLEIYSGGLGTLAGDHLKSASDLGINIIGVSLFYKLGYVTQMIDKHGKQVNLFKSAEYSFLPLKAIKDENGNEILIDIELPDRKIFAKVWKIKVGRCFLILLDTNIPENNKEDITITYRLYDDGKYRERRLLQEIVLGIGGVKALKKLNIKPDVWHLNEGHSAFIIFELLKDEILENNLNFEEASKKVKSKILFTTHTPVKEGHESFPKKLIENYFKSYANIFKIDLNELLYLGNFNDEKHPNFFSMTIFALKFSEKCNAVSELNQKVSKNLWHKVWADKKIEDVSIDYVTNGVHHPTWVAKEFDELYKKYISENWKLEVDNKNIWKRIYNIPDKEIFEIHLKLKKRLIEFVKENVLNLYKRNGVENKIINKIIESLSEEKLTIGFARRFAAYKRATLIFKNEKSLIEILNNEQYPIQIIFAGKAYPTDKNGLELVKDIYKYSLKKEFLGKIIILENYSIEMAQYLVQGCDVWLNNPRKPYEASGTSGQKAAMNGVLNFSILDGWWPEAYNGKNGFAIESADSNLSWEKQDKIECENLHQTLKNKIVPIYYSRDENNLPKKWIEMMKESIATITPVFNTHRMLKEYYEKFYKPIYEK